MELLAPAGGFEQLEAAIHFGADAVYLGGEHFGMRKRADNFSDDDIARAVDLAHAAGVKVHVTVNVLMHESDLDGTIFGEGEPPLETHLRMLGDAGVDAIIAGDLATIVLARRIIPDVAVHASTQLSCANHEAARVLHELGAKRIVLARELALAEIAEIRKRVPSDLELEVFVHGAMCMAISGRCLISNHLAGRDANRGHCAQSCRWMYTLEEEKRLGVHIPVEEGERGTAIMSSKDLMMLDHLDELRAAGVDSVKIEGRVKGAYYVATVVNAYRRVLDGADLAEYLSELDAVSHRAYHTGFFYGQPDQTGADIAYEQTHILAGDVLSCESLPVKDGEPRWRVVFAVRNRLEMGREVEVLSPGHPVRSFELGPLEHVESGRMTRVADRTPEAYACDIPFEVCKGDILRRVIEPRERRCG